MNSLIAVGDMFSLMAEFLSFLINLEIAGFIVPDNLSLKLNVMFVIHGSICGATNYKTDYESSRVLFK
jgi:hypothetical protein